MKVTNVNFRIQLAKKHGDDLLYADLTDMKADDQKKRHQEIISTYEKAVIHINYEDNSEWWIINFDKLCYERSDRKIIFHGIDEFKPHVDFPYRNYYMSDELKIKLFQNIVNHKFEMVRLIDSVIKIPVDLPSYYFTYLGRTVKLMAEDDVFEKYMQLSDAFQDQCKVECRFGKNDIPFDYFQREYKSFLRPGKPLDKVREEIYFKTKVCSSHNPTIIKHFIKKFKAKRVLDMSAGWGDRLLGVLASDVEHYLATDPNLCVHRGYKEMVDTYGTQGKIEIHEEPFEKLDLSEYKNYFDIMYTSPPYFDYELYNKHGKGQSVEGNRTQDSWVHNFLKPSVLKIVDCLKNNGKFIFYIGQKRGDTYVELIIRWMNKLKNLYFVGSCIYADVAGTKSQPIYIFIKKDKIPRSLANPRPQYIGNLINETIIPGTSLTRAVLPTLIKQNPLSVNLESVGYLAIAVAYSLNLMKSNIPFYINENPDHGNLMQKCIKEFYPAVEFGEHPSEFYFKVSDESLMDIIDYVLPDDVKVLWLSNHDKLIGDMIKSTKTFDVKYYFDFTERQIEIPQGDHVWRSWNDKFWLKF